MKYDFAPAGYVGCHSERSEESLISSGAIHTENSQRCFASLLMTSFVSLSKSMRVKTTVGTPRCGVRSAQRADPTIRARQAICVIPAPKITPNVLGNLHMAALFMRGSTESVRQPAISLLLALLLTRRSLSD